MQHPNKKNIYDYMTFLLYIQEEIYRKYQYYFTVVIG